MKKTLLGIFFLLFALIETSIASNSNLISITNSAVTIGENDPRLVVAGSDYQVIAKFKFSAYDEDLKLLKLRIKIQASDANGTVSSAMNEIYSISLYNGTALISGPMLPVAMDRYTIADFYIPDYQIEPLFRINKNSNTDLTVRVNYNSTSKGARSGIKLTTFIDKNNLEIKGINSNNLIQSLDNDVVSENSVCLYKSIPAVFSNPLPTNLLISGNNIIGKINITAHPFGDIDWRVINLSINLVNATASNFTLLGDNGEVLAVYHETVTLPETISFVTNSDQKITAGSYKTYTIKADVISGEGYSQISTYINKDDNFINPTSITIAKSSLVWSDESDTNHGNGNTSQDWNGSYMMNCLPTSMQSLTKNEKINQLDSINLSINQGYSVNLKDKESMAIISFLGNGSLKKSEMNIVSSKRMMLYGVGVYKNIGNLKINIGKDYWNFLVVDSTEKDYTYQLLFKAGDSLPALNISTNDTTYTLELYFKNKNPLLEEPIKFNNVKIFNKDNIIVNAINSYNFSMIFKDTVTEPPVPSDSAIQFRLTNEYGINKYSPEFQLNFQVLNKFYYLDEISFYISYSEDFYLYASGGRDSNKTPTDYDIWTKIDSISYANGVVTKKVTFYRGRDRKIEPCSKWYTCVELYFKIKQPNSIIEPTYRAININSIKTINNYAELKNNDSTSTTIYFQGMNSVFETDMKEVKLFPNPSVGKFNLSFTANFSEQGLLNIYNISGQLLEQKTVNITSGENFINVELSHQYMDGIYYYEIKTNKQTKNGKFIIIQ